MKGRPREHHAVLLLWARPTPQDTISLSYSHRILQWVFDFSLSQEHIPSAHSPKHALKGWDPLPVDHTSHEAVGRRVRLGTPGCETGKRRDYILHRGPWTVVRGLSATLFFLTASLDTSEGCQKIQTNLGKALGVSEQSGS